MAQRESPPNSLGIGAVPDRKAETKPNMPVRAYPQSISLQPYLGRLRDRYCVTIDDISRFPILASKLLTWKQFRKTVLRQVAVRFPEDEPPNWHELVSAARCGAADRAEEV